LLPLEETAAALALAPWDGDVFTFRVRPRGRFAHLVAGMSPRQRGFAQWGAIDPACRGNLLRLGAGRIDDLAPLLGFFGDERAELGRRALKRHAA